MIHLAVYQIQANIRNVEFAYRKKTFPRFEDVGLANIVMDGNGLSVITKTALDPNLPYTTLVPLQIEAHIDSLRIELLESHHPMVYRVFGKALTSAIKKRICLAIEAKVYDAIRRMDAVVTRAWKSSHGEHNKTSFNRGLMLW